MSSSFSSDQDLPNRHNTESHTKPPETTSNMDEENTAEVEYVANSNRLDERGDNNDAVNRVQRSAELFFGFSTLVVGLALVGVTPYQRPIPAKQLQNGDFFFNLTNNEQFRGQTVSDVVLVLVAILVPLCIQLFLGGKKDWHKTLCVYFTTVGLTITLTNCVKIYAGYLRPIFLQGCEPDENYETCTSGADREMRLSFPSGHASVAFCGLCVFSFFLEHHYGMSASRVLLLKKESGELLMTYKQQNSRFMRIRSILCYFPVVVAIFIAASRVHDNMHFPADVVGGALLGGSVAILVHQTWYPNFPTLETITHEMSN